MDFLKFGFPGMYLFVCDVKKMSSELFREMCKTCEEGDPEVYTFYILGWFLPFLSQLRAQNKLT